MAIKIRAFSLAKSKALVCISNALRSRSPVFDRLNAKVHGGKLQDLGALNNACPVDESVYDKGCEALFDQYVEDSPSAETFVFGTRKPFTTL